MLAALYDVITGGPESVLTLGFHGGPQWRGGAVYLPCYEPLYANAAVVLGAVEQSDRARRRDLDPDRAPHGLGGRRRVRALGRLARRIAPYAASWDDFLGAVDASRALEPTGRAADGGGCPHGRGPGRGGARACACAVVASAPCPARLANHRRAADPLLRQHQPERVRGGAGWSAGGRAGRALGRASTPSEGRPAPHATIAGARPVRGGPVRPSLTAGHARRSRPGVRRSSCSTSRTSPRSPCCAPPALARTHLLGSLDGTPRVLIADPHGRGEAVLEIDPGARRRAPSTTRRRPRPSDRSARRSRRRLRRLQRLGQRDLDQPAPPDVAAGGRRQPRPVHRVARTAPPRPRFGTRPAADRPAAAARSGAAAPPRRGDGAVAARAAPALERRQSAR